MLQGNATEPGGSKRKEPIMGFARPRGGHIMSVITRCRKCGGNIVEPAYPGDGAYPVPPMCRCMKSK